MEPLVDPHRLIFRAMFSHLFRLMELRLSRLFLYLTPSIFEHSTVLLDLLAQQVLLEPLDPRDLAEPRVRQGQLEQPLLL